MIAIIGLHPLSKVSKKKRVRKKGREAKKEKKVHFLETFYLTAAALLYLFIMQKQMQVTLSEKTRVSLLC